jgi:hypothetical protein
VIDIDEDQLAQERRANRDRRDGLCAELKRRVSEQKAGAAADLADAAIDRLTRDIAECEARDARLHDLLLRAQNG